MTGRFIIQANINSPKDVKLSIKFSDQRERIRRQPSGSSHWLAALPPCDIVILSVAKNLAIYCGKTEILRCAQDDRLMLLRSLRAHNIVAEIFFKRLGQRLAHRPFATAT